jgi:hypothetical protein
MKGCDTAVKTLEELRAIILTIIHAGEEEKAKNQDSTTQSW